MEKLEITRKEKKPAVNSNQTSYAPDAPGSPSRWTSSAKAHAEYLKIQRSLLDGKVFDLPPQTVKRYITDKTVLPRMVWRFNHRIPSIPCGKMLRIETMGKAYIHWNDDDWKTVHDVKDSRQILGIHFADLPTKSLPEGKQIKFTFYWPEADGWEGTDFEIQVSSSK